jgi:hypothetical protein
MSTAHQRRTLEGQKPTKGHAMTLKQKLRALWADIKVALREPWPPPDLPPIRDYPSGPRR